MSKAASVARLSTKYAKLIGWSSHFRRVVSTISEHIIGWLFNEGALKYSFYTRKRERKEWKMMNRERNGPLYIDSSSQRMMSMIRCTDYS